MSDTEGQSGARFFDEKKLMFLLMLWMLLFYFVHAGAPEGFLKSCVWAFMVLTFTTFFIRDLQKDNSNIAEILKILAGKGEP